MKPVLIIAEAGVNHNGSLELAKQLVKVAKACGANVVKFQTAQLDSLVSKHAEMAEYQKKNTGKVQSQKEMLSQLLLPFSAFEELARTCEQEGIQFLSTPFDVESIRFLTPLVDLWKVPSGEITNYPYLVEIARTGKPVILSTGMSELAEIDEAVQVLRTHGCYDLTLLHCTTQYPAPYDSVNLRAMQTLQHRYGVPVGYSDHTDGIEVPVAATALGAAVLEKHFTLDRAMEGPDHKASLDPDGLRAMIQSVRRIEQALGDGEKTVTAAEAPNRAVARKSIVARCDIREGERLTEQNLTTKRPGTGLSPMRWKDLLGTPARRDFAEDEMIEV